MSIHSIDFQKNLKSNRGDVFILISVAVSIVIFTMVAGYQLILSNKLKSNLLLTQSTETFLQNETMAWSGYFRAEAGLEPFPEEGAEAEEGMITRVTAPTNGNIRPVQLAMGHTRGKKNGDDFCGVAERGNMLCIGRRTLTPVSQPDEDVEDDDTSPVSAVVKELITKNSQDRFGQSLAISGDTMVVGAPFEDSLQHQITNGTTSSTSEFSTDSGAVFVYKRTGKIWAQEAYLKAFPVAGRNFGASVAISGDTIVVGAPYDMGGWTGVLKEAQTDLQKRAFDSGSAFVFKRTNSKWHFEAYLKASNSATGFHFGKTVAIEGDTIVVAAPDADVCSKGEKKCGYPYRGAGSVYVYRRFANLWSEEALLTGGDKSYSSKQFGFSLALSGNTLAVARPAGFCSFSDDGRGGGCLYQEDGDVFIYEHTNGMWPLVKRFKNHIEHKARGPGSFFGYSLALSGDTLAVGEPGQQRVHVYSRQNSVWSSDRVSLAPEKSNDSRRAVGFGTSLALSADTLIIGLPNIDAYSLRYEPYRGTKPGATLIYKREKANWNKEVVVEAVNGTGSDMFGKPAFDGSTLVVGAPGEDSKQNFITNGTTTSKNNSALNSGAAYVFHPFDKGWTQEAYVKASNTYQHP